MLSSQGLKKNQVLGKIIIREVRFHGLLYLHTLNVIFKIALVLDIHAINSETTKNLNFPQISAYILITDIR